MTTGYRTSSLYMLATNMVSVARQFRWKSWGTGQRFYAVTSSGFEPVGVLLWITDELRQWILRAVLVNFPMVLSFSLAQLATSRIRGFGR